MLHIRRWSEPTALWAARGWPPLLRWTDRPEVPWLFWALHEVAGAAQAADFDAVDDLLTEAGHDAGKESGQIHQPAPAESDVMSISTGLWAEVQRGRGATDLTQVALHAQLLRNLVAPGAGELPTRLARLPPPTAHPKNASRAGTCHWPAPAAIRGRELQEQFLLLIATVLSNGGEHLVDPTRARTSPEEPTRC